MSKNSAFEWLTESLINNRITCGITDIALSERLLHEGNLSIKKTIQSSGQQIFVLTVKTGDVVIEVVVWRCSPSETTEVGN